MNLTISGKQNIEFYLLMVGLGAAAEAYKYKHISLGIFESLHYDMSMIDLIDEYQLSKDLREIVFPKVWAWKILLMQQSGLKTLIGKAICVMR